MRDIRRLFEYEEENDYYNPSLKIPRKFRNINERKWLYFDSAQLVYYKYDKVNFRHDGSYIDSADWRKNKKATLYPKDAKDKCFHYAVNVALNYE